jgi:predicted CopG family antitoxin
MKKMRVVTISLSDDEYAMYQRLAKVEGKNFSDFVRKKLKQAVTEEMKEANLLNYLVRLLEELPTRLDIKLKEAGKGIGWEEFSQLARLIIYHMKLTELLSEYVIVIDAKRKEFQERKNQLRKELGVEV